MRGCSHRSTRGCPPACNPYRSRRCCPPVVCCGAKCARKCVNACEHDGPCLCMNTKGATASEKGRTTHTDTKIIAHKPTCTHTNNAPASRTAPFRGKLIQTCSSEKHDEQSKTATLTRRTWARALGSPSTPATTENAKQERAPMLTHAQRMPTGRVRT